MRQEMRTHRRGILSTRIAPLAAVLLFVGCVADPTPPPAPADLPERNRALEEVKKQLAFMKTATPAELQVLLQHKDHRVRARAARSLGQRGSEAKSVLPSLVQTLKDESREVRIEATMALGEIGDSTTIAPLLETLVDKERKVRFWGWKAIRQFGEDAYPVLVQNLTADSPYNERFYTDEAGRKTNFQTELRNRIVALERKIIPYLTKALSDEDASLQINAIRTLAGFGKAARSALPELADALSATDDMDEQIEIIRAMRNIGDLDPIVIPTLTQATRSPDQRVAKEAKIALKKLK